MAGTIDYVFNGCKRESMTEAADKEKVGILGGTFNPVHIGHLILARDAMEAHALARVVFIPCARPAHKPAGRLAPADRRLAMLKCATVGEPAFEVSRIELDRDGISYAMDTVAALRKQEPGVEWHFIIGADTLPELHTWRHIDDLLNMCRFITMRRPGMPDRETLAQRLRLPEPWPERLMRDVFDGHLIDISSSEIRKRVAEKRSIRYLVPRDVETYIAEHELYVTEENL